MKLIYCLIVLTVSSNYCACNKSEKPKFQPEYQWSYINFTWQNEETYKDAARSKKYIPENNAMAGIKFYKDKFYIAMPRIRAGTPVTLGSISTNEQTPKMNPLITPFPDWNRNNPNADCTNLESVQSMEIDAEGIMWVLDGFRIHSNAKCPPKLILFDLNDKGKIIHTFDFPENICLSKGGFLNDIVVDDSDGGFAYITDNGDIDPGLIVYSREKNRAWKLRDASMFAEKRAAGYEVEGYKFPKLTPIDGIALGPANSTGTRNVYYCALTGLSLYSIGTDILKNEEMCSGGEWRYNVTHVGDKQASSDGLVVDNKGNLFYGLLPLYAVGKWNINEDFSNAEIVDQNNKTMIWTDSFAFDDKGHLYLLANNIHKFFDPGFKLEKTDKIMFRILKMSTSTQSYLH